MGEQLLHYRSITELAAMLRSGETTPTGLTAHFIERIEKLNGPLNAFNLVTADRAMAEAQSAEALLGSGRDLGPLHGIPYGVKDLYDVVGMPTTAGSQTLEPDLKTEESEVTRRLAAAGMIVLGKTITVEFAKGIVGINHIQGTPHNPGARNIVCQVVQVRARRSRWRAVWLLWDLARTPADLSVYRLAFLEPSASNRLLDGSVVRCLPAKLDIGSVGPLTRSVEDAALICQILQGEDARDESTIGIQPKDVLGSLKAGVKGLRFGIPEHVFFDNADPEVEKAVLATADVSKLGAIVENVSYPEAEAVTQMSSVVNGVEAAVIHEERLKTKLDLMDPFVESANAE